jgi:hypothetical protein
LQAATSITFLRSLYRAAPEGRRMSGERTEAEQMLVDDEAKQLDAVVLSLLEKFPGVGEERIRQEVQVIAEGLADARVRTFLPLLVDHAARDRLRTVSAS